MTPDDALTTTRRARRAATGEPPVTPTGPETPEGVLTLDADVARAGASRGSVAAPATVATDVASTTPVGLSPRSTTAAKEKGERRIALAWVDESALSRRSAPIGLDGASAAYIPVGADLLADPPRRSPLRSGVVIPTLAIAGVLGAYAATTIAWPLHAVTPTITAVAVQPAAAPAAAPAWPATGSAAVSVGGIAGTLASGTDPDSIASITKIVTALVVLDQMPLSVGEQGPEFRFGYWDSAAYWDYRAAGESALDVPAGGSLTEYQMLEGMLIGSANNYADRLADNLFPSDAVFASAAMSWLQTHGVPGVTIVEPTGMDAGNSASPEALITLAQKAMTHPVIAEIVAKKSVELPGAGLVESTNGLLADPGVVGIKTGTLDSSNLLSAKDVVIGDTTVRMFASVLGQPDDAARLAASRALYAQLEKELQLTPSVTAGTLAGSVETAWGEDVSVVAGDDAAVVLWNSGAPTATTAYALGDHREEGDVVGSLTVTGPLDSTTVDLRLAEDIEGPSIWWRLTHPLELFGLAD
ncbi:D-alanyl-D-alanine carboxypeptidase family protein [Microbacterium sp. SSM24]|uniref:D-alanyl-D-alanine carboxypeptidase family protein n=1 Tax=Microbacterium sp. SSM24 TaxID=2991714 RepID=UPI00222698B3|nr:D-alanyl-D-alanine carboxypeptidase [Microbacterium sp. SSM24]MCW3493180.1 D-alanyl-D-alanine carboxypeptidase [Microbacterium sp. SSM24]